MSETREGGCLCGKVRFRASGAPKWTAHCHCNSCRKFTGAMFATYAGYETGAVTQLGASPVRHHSSEGVTRSFCGECGTPVSYESARWPGEVHLLVCAFDDPNAFEPEVHVFWAERVPWLRIADDLPKFDSVPSEQ